MNKSIKHICLCHFLTIILNCTYGQTNNNIIIGKIDSLHSNILNENRKIWVYTPEIAGIKPSENRNYPVVYLLDGDDHFKSLAGMIDFLSLNSGFPKMIIVGIPNTDRTRDLTPSHVAADLPALDSSFCKNSGGGEKFIAFIEKELMPFVENKYSIGTHKTLIGHSLGGLMVINALVHHTELFSAYISIDPSMWWDNKKLLNEAKNALTTQKYPGKSLYLSIANTMPEEMKLKNVEIDTSSATKHIRSILELKNYLGKNKQNELNFKSNYYENDTHNSVPLISEYDGLRFIFNYSFIKLPTKNLSDKGLAEKYENYFNQISKQMAYPVTPDENLFNALCYETMQNNNYASAKNFFEMNLKYYPQSSNVYDSMGDYYNTVGDKTNAINNYKKALSIFKNEETKKKLDELLKK